jgi:hypothetical protein
MWRERVTEEVPCDTAFAIGFELPLSALNLTRLGVWVENCKRGVVCPTALAVPFVAGDSRMGLESERRVAGFCIDEESKCRAETAGLDLSRSSAVGYLNTAFRPGVRTQFVGK